MPKTPENLVLGIGFWFGNLIVYLLEKAVPSFRDKEQDLYGFKDYYLKRFNLSNKENFKRNIKLGIVLWATLLFWAYCATLLNNVFRIFDVKLHTALLTAIAILGLIFALLTLWVSCKISFKE